MWKCLPRILGPTSPPIQGCSGCLPEIMVRNASRLIALTEQGKGGGGQG